MRKLEAMIITASCKDEAVKLVGDNKQLKRLVRMYFKDTEKDSEEEFKSMINRINMAKNIIRNNSKIGEGGISSVIETDFTSNEIMKDVEEANRILREFVEKETLLAYDHPCAYSGRVDKMIK